MEACVPAVSEGGEPEKWVSAIWGQVGGGAMGPKLPEQPWPREPHESTLCISRRRGGLPKSPNEAVGAEVWNWAGLQGLPRTTPGPQPPAQAPFTRSRQPAVGSRGASQRGSPHTCQSLALLGILSPTMGA